MSLRVAFIGCVESSRVALETLLALPRTSCDVVGLMTRRASHANSDFADLTPLVEGREIPLLFAEDAPTAEQQAEWLAARHPDVTMCIGWSRLLDDRVIRVAPHGTIGFHPTALPANRGRHPLIWSLALGLEETASSFFCMEAVADSGPIINQRRIPITRDDDARTLYAKVLDSIREQVVSIVDDLAAGTLTPVPQDQSVANQWRKRTAVDGQIDWRMSADAVYNLVRALTRPYPGAHFVHNAAQFKVWRCVVNTADAINLEPGKVLAVRGNEITVKCGTDAVCLIEHDMRTLPTPGSYL